MTVCFLRKKFLNIENVLADRAYSTYEIVQFLKEKGANI